MRELKQSTIDRIHKCTISEIEEHGVTGLRISRIARAARVSEPLIHKYFGNRQSLISTVLSKAVEDFFLPEFNEIVELVFSGAASIGSKKALNLIPRPNDQNRLRIRKLRMIIFAASFNSPSLRSAVGNAQRGIHDKICEFIVNARSRTGSTSKIDTDALAYAIQAMLFGFILNDLDPEHPLSDNDFKILFADLLRRHIVDK